MNNRKSSLDAEAKNNLEESVYVHVLYMHIASLAHSLLLSRMKIAKATHLIPVTILTNRCGGALSAEAYLEPQLGYRAGEDDWCDHQQRVLWLKIEIDLVG